MIYHREWSSANVAPMIDRLTDLPGTLDPEGEPSSVFRHFRDNCLAREGRGRDHFGYTFMGRNNAIEGLEEAADGTNYAFMEVLRARRAGAEEFQDIAATAAYHFFKAYEQLTLLHNKRNGAP